VGDNNLANVFDEEEDDLVGDNNLANVFDEEEDDQDEVEGVNDVEPAIADQLAAAGEQGIEGNVDTDEEEI